MGLKLGELAGFPAAAALGQDAGQQRGAGFKGRCFPRSPGVLGCTPFGGERAFDRRFQQRLAVLPQLFLRRLEFRHAHVQVGQQFFEFSDDAGLFGGRCDK